MSAAVCLVLPQQQQQPQQVMLLNSYGGGEQGSEDSLEDSQALLPQDKKSLSSMLAQRAMHERRLKPPDHIIPCPRCQSINTKFCYYNNYSLTQPRHFCKNCRRYWTAGGTLRNVPVGGGCRKNKRVKRNNADSSNASSVDSSVCGFRSEAGNGGSPSVHQSFLQAAGGSSSSSFFDAPQFDEATKAAIARAQQVIRAGPSGVGHSSHESSPGSDGPGPGPGPGPLNSSLTTQTFDSGIMAQGFFGSAAAAKHEGGPLSNGDLSSIFEAHAFRAAAAGGQPLSDGLNGYSHHVSDVDAYGGGGHHVETDGHHSHWRVQHKAAAELWAEEEHQHQHAQEREEAVQMPRGSDHHRKASVSAAHGHAESLRHALKGKSSLCLSPSSGLDEEGSSPCSSVWAPANPNLNPYESTQDPGFNWPGSWTTPLDLMPPSAVQFGMRSEHLFDLPKSNLVNPVTVGFGLDEFHSADRKLA